MKRKSRKKSIKVLVLLAVIISVILGKTVYAQDDVGAEKGIVQDTVSGKNNTDHLFNIQEKDKNGLHLEAGSVKKTYLPFEKIQLVLQIENTGYPEIRDIETKVSAPSGFRMDAEDKKDTQRETLGLGEVMTVHYEGYNTIAVLMFLGVGAGVLVLLVFFFLLFRFIKNKKRRRQITAGIVLLTLIGQPSVTFAAEVTEYSISSSIAEGVMLNDSIWEDTEVSMQQEVRVGLSKPSVTYQVSFKQDSRLNAYIEKTDGSIHLAWNEIEGLEFYEIYKKEGSGEYALVDTTDSLEYVVESSGEGQIDTFQILGYYKDGTQAICSNECRYITQNGEEFADSDGDNLQDFIEEEFGTSPVLSDTDGDGLSDSIEIYQTFTDPLKADTNGDGIRDDQEDLDFDGLSNLWEQKIGTSPLEPDTDGDGLSDGDEWPESVQEPFSDPLTADTDEDALDDRMEKDLGTDPWKPDTNGDGILDFEDTYIKEYTMAGSDSVINVKAPAEALINARMIDYTYTSVLSEKDYVVSEVTCMDMEDEFESASVSMKINEDKVPDGDYENVSMFYYNEELNGFEEMSDQSYDPETQMITAPTTHFSTFVLVYVPNWHAQLEPAVSPDRSEDGEAVFADVSFVIDESSSMEDGSKSTPNDPNRYRVQAAKNFVDGLISGDRAAVVGFATEADRKCNLTDDLNSVKANIDTIVGNMGGTAMYTGLREALRELTENHDPERAQFIIVLSDGEDTSSEEGAYEEITNTALQYGIAIYCIALGAGADVSTLSEISLNTGGDYFRIDSADDLPQVYNRIAGNAVMGPDTDKDGLADKVEDYGIRDGLGNIYHTKTDVYDTDEDEISDGDEVGGIFKQDEEIEYYIVLTDPVNADTDGDGLTDQEELEAGTLAWCTDTDGDGLSDGLEWQTGFSPLDANRDGDAFGDYAEYMDSAKAFSDFINMDNMDEDDWLYYFCNFAYNMLDRDPYTYDLCDAEILLSILAAILIGDFGTNLAEAGLLNANYVNSVYYLAGGIIGGLIPGWDKISSLRDMIADFIQGNPAGAALNAVGAIPLLGEGSEVMADVTMAITKTLDDLPNLQRLVLWISDSFRTSAKFFYTQDMFIEASKKMIKDGFKNIVQRKGLQKAQLIEDFIKYTDETELLFTNRLMGASDNAVHFLGEVSGSPQQMAAAARKALGNQLGGQVTEETVDGTIQKVYSKVSVLDLDADTYKNTDNLKRTLLRRAESVKEFGGSNRIDMTGVSVRRLDIAVPNTLMSDDISETLLQAQQEALDNGIQIRYQVYTANGVGGTFFDEMQNLNGDKKIADPDNTVEIADNGTGNGNTDADTDYRKAMAEADTESIIRSHNERIAKIDTSDIICEKVTPEVSNMAKRATNIPASAGAEPDSVMLGRMKTIKNENGEAVLAPDSYQKLAEDNQCIYYELPEKEWEELLKDRGEAYMTTINIEFLNQMIDKKKTFIFSADPNAAPGSYYWKEYQYITRLIEKGEDIKIEKIWEDN